MVKRSYSGSSYSVAKKSRSMVKYVPRRPSYKPETKSVIRTDTQTMYGGGIYSHYFTLLNGLALGAEADQRIGRKVRMASVEFDLAFKLGGTVTEYDNGFWSLIYDKRPNGVTPILTDVFLPSGGYGTVILNETLHPGRFIELSRGNWNVGIAKSWVQTVHRKVSLGNKLVEFRDSSASITGIDSGAVFLVYGAADSGTILADGTKVNIVTKIKYVDL